MTDVEKDLVHKIVLMAIACISAVALVAIIAITCNSIQTSKLINSIYDYDYPTTITNDTEVNYNDD